MLSDKDFTLFHHVCQSAPLKIIELFAGHLNKHGDFDIRTGQEWTPLMYAISGKQPIEVIRFLVAKGASVDWIS